ncbi:hypothetical protein FOCC_FOCC011932 [Frankliniella occidentalis]|nr:hypothetical protein FOCC_FOCC011932 [Frankliniella occidentalis]
MLLVFRYFCPGLKKGKWRPTGKKKTTVLSMSTLKPMSVEEKSAHANSRMTKCGSRMILQSDLKKCSSATCSSCSISGIDSSECQGKCVIDCWCGCYGVPGASMSNIPQIETCLGDDDCTAKKTKCESSCSDQSCLVSCYMDFMKCTCECNDAISLRPALGLSVALLALWEITGVKWKVMIRQPETKRKYRTDTHSDTVIHLLVIRDRTVPTTTTTTTTTH